MTITDSDIRLALERAVEQADLTLDLAPQAHEEPTPLRPGPRWHRTFAAAAAVLVVLAVAAVAARTGSDAVRTGPTDETTQPSTSAMPTAGPTGTVPPDPSSLTVMVVNGGNTPFEADELTEQLASAGYQTRTPDNAFDRVDPTRVFFAPGHEVAAQDLAVRIGRSEIASSVQPLPVRPLATTQADDVDVVVVIGRDWQARALVTPDPAATYATTTTSPPSLSGPPFVLWAGTPADAAQRTTPEGALRALIAAVDPTIAVDDVTVTPGRHSGWQTVTARLGGTVYVGASTAPSEDGWVISGLEDLDHPDLSSALLGTDGRLVVPAPAGTTSAMVYDLGLDPVRPGYYPEPGTETALDQITDQPSLGFEFRGKPKTEVADHLVIGRDASGAITTIRAFKIGP